MCSHSQCLPDVHHLHSQVSAGVGALPLDLRDFIASKPKLGDTLKPMPNERALLSFLVSRIANLDPDVIVGHNICGFDMDVLLHRIAHNNVQNWVRVSPAALVCRSVCASLFPTASPRWCSGFVLALYSCPV